MANYFPTGVSDIDREILLWLEKTDLYATFCVNKYLNTVCDPFFWKRKLATDYVDVDALLENTTYENIYRGLMKTTIHNRLLFAVRCGCVSLVFYVLNEYNKRRRFSAEWRGNDGLMKRCYSLEDAAKFACRLGHLDIVRILYEHGADHRVVVYAATRYNHIDFITSLLNSDKQKIEDSLNNALIIASRCGHLDLTKLLLESGANVHAGHDVPLRLAVRRNHIGVIHLLLEYGANIHLNNDRVLIEAAKAGKINLINFLLHSGLDIHIRGIDAIIAAIKHNRVDIVKYFIKLGVDINAKNGLALSTAARLGNVKIVQTLLKLGANVHANYDNAFIAAVKCNHIDIVRILIKSGTDVNIRNNKAMIIAIKRKYTQIIDLLYNNTTKQFNNNDIMINAVTAGNVDLINLMHKSGAEITCKLIEIAINLQRANNDTIMFLLENIKRIDNYDIVMKYAIKSNNIILVKRLLDIKSTEKILKSSLETAILLFKIDIIKLLLDHGANRILNINKDRLTNLFIEYVNSYPDLQIIELLLENGADVHTKSDELGSKDDALFFAAISNDLPLAKLLLKYGGKFDRYQLSKYTKSCIEKKTINYIRAELKERVNDKQISNGPTNRLSNNKSSVNGALTNNQCKGITKAGERCKFKASVNGYCNKHKQRQTEANNTKCTEGTSVFRSFRASE